MTCSSRRRIPSACSAALFLLLLAPSPPAAAQQPTPSADETLVGQLAALLAAADARRLDAAAIRDALANPNPVVRRQAALAAGRIGDVAAVDLLVPALSDTSDVVRAAAAFALGLLKDARAVAPLLQLVRATRAADQGPTEIEAVTAIAKIGGEEGARALADVMATGSPGAPPPAPPAVTAALLESWRLGTRAPVTELVAYAESPDLTARWRALYALGRLRAPRGAARLVAALTDRDAGIRAVAARGVTKALLDSARIDARSAVDRLRPLLEEQNPQIRINALRALGSFRDSGLAAAVAPLVADQNIGVAVQAETTLGALRGSPALQALRPRLASSVFALRRQALIALAQADSAAGVAAAVQVAGDADWRWRSVAAEAFGAARARAPRARRRRRP